MQIFCRFNLISQNSSSFYTRREKQITDRLNKTQASDQWNLQANAAFQVSAFALLLSTLTRFRWRGDHRPPQTSLFLLTLYARALVHLDSHTCTHSSVRVFPFPITPGRCAVRDCTSGGDLVCALPEPPVDAWRYEHRAPPEIPIANVHTSRCSPLERSCSSTVHWNVTSHWLEFELLFEANRETNFSHLILFVQIVSYQLLPLSIHRILKKNTDVESTRDCWASQSDQFPQWRCLLGPCRRRCCLRRRSCSRRGGRQWRWCARRRSHSAISTFPLASRHLCHLRTRTSASELEWRSPRTARSYSSSNRRSSYIPQRRSHAAASGPNSSSSSRRPHSTFLCRCSTTRASHRCCSLGRALRPPSGASRVPCRCLSSSRPLAASSSNNKKASSSTLREWRRSRATGSASDRTCDCSTRARRTSRRLVLPAPPIKAPCSTCTRQLLTLIALPPLPTYLPTTTCRWYSIIFDT